MGIFEPKENTGDGLSITTRVNVAELREQAAAATLRRQELELAKAQEHELTHKGSYKATLEEIEVSFHAPIIMELLILGGRNKATKYCQDRYFTKADTEALIAQAQILLHEVSKTKGKEMLDVALSRYHLIFEQNVHTDPTVALRAQQQIDKLVGLGEDHDPEKVITAFAQVMRKVTGEEAARWNHDVTDAEFTHKPTEEDDAEHDK